MTDEVRSDGGWSAPPNPWDLLPALSIRRGGIQFPPPPTIPTIRVYRTGLRYRLRLNWRHRWAWHATTPPPKGRGQAGTARTRWGARRAAIRWVRADPTWRDWQP